MRVVIAEDSVLLREGLSRLLTESGLDVVAAVADGESALRAVEDYQPDVAVLDVRMPPTHTDEGLRAALVIRRQWPDVAVLVLSQYLEAAYAVRLLEADQLGRVGYLLKDRVTDIPTFIQAVRRVASGETVVDPAVISTLVQRQRVDNPLDRLTQRERDVLALMAEGWSNQGIGERLSLAPKTVETHVGVILAKLGLAESPDENRRVLAVLAFLRGSARP